MEIRVGGSRVQSCLWLHGKLEGSLGYIRLYLKTPKLIHLKAKQFEGPY